MNIRDAKREIQEALHAYHKKDSLGVYRYPSVRQRPILLMGPPGIGKTAIMEQIAQECGVGLVAYTMTHHTRQSAIGLPRVMEKNYQGEQFLVTEYTLSEILTSVYECMETSGTKEGILFLDEINCVSETLAPVMLQFLQNKQFGNHRLPDGWMIVAAGNPAEYNKSVREFDIVTLDRVRRIDVEADLECWLDYAYDAGMHGAIISYLKLKPERFYKIMQERDRKTFVTARGWEDLSALLQSYEEDGIAVKEAQIAQFLQDPSAAADFAAYYQVYCRMGSEFHAKELLEDITSPGNFSADQISQIRDKIENGSMEIRFTFVGQMIDVLKQRFQKYAATEEFVSDLQEEMTRVHGKAISLEEYIDEREETLLREVRTRLINQEKERKMRHILQVLREMDVECRTRGNQEQVIVEKQRAFLDALTKQAEQLDAMLTKGFDFLNSLQMENGELFLYVSSIARMKSAAAFLISHPNEAFLKNSGRLCNEDTPAQILADLGE